MHGRSNARFSGTNREGEDVYYVDDRVRIYPNYSLTDEQLSCYTNTMELVNNVIYKFSNLQFKNKITTSNLDVQNYTEEITYLPLKLIDKYPKNSKGENNILNIDYKKTDIVSDNITVGDILNKIDEQEFTYSIVVSASENNSSHNYLQKSDAVTCYYLKESTPRIEFGDIEYSNIAGEGKIQGTFVNSHGNKSIQNFKWIIYDVSKTNELYSIGPIQSSDFVLTYGNFIPGQQYYIYAEVTDQYGQVYTHGEFTVWNELPNQLVFKNQTILDYEKTGIKVEWSLPEYGEIEEPFTVVPSVINAEVKNENNEVIGSQLVDSTDENKVVKDYTGQILENYIDSGILFKKYNYNDRINIPYYGERYVSMHLKCFNSIFGTNSPFVQFSLTNNSTVKLGLGKVLLDTTAPNNQISFWIDNNSNTLNEHIEILQNYELRETLENAYLFIEFDMFTNEFYASLYSLNKDTPIKCFSVNGQMQSSANGRFLDANATEQVSSIELLLFHSLDFIGLSILQINIYKSNVNTTFLSKSWIFLKL